MAKKAFEIQGTTLTIGGVDLQAGTTSIVIPGVTQAASYIAKEVKNYNDQFGPGGETIPTDWTGTPVVIDSITFQIATGAQVPDRWVQAVYTVTEVENGEIKEIEVTDGGAGYEPLGDAPLNAVGEVCYQNFMWAAPQGTETDISSPDWIPQSVNLVTNDYVQLQWTTPTGVEEADPNETEEPKNWLYVESGGVFVETNINTGSGSTHGWLFNTSGGLEFPDGTTQTTAYTGQSGGGGTIAGTTYYVMANSSGEVLTSTDGVSWSEPVNVTSNGINHVATDGVNIVYVDGNTIGYTLFETPSTATEITASIPGMADIVLYQIIYAGGYFVVAGRCANGVYNQPMYGYSTNGVAWTFKTITDSALLLTLANNANEDSRFSDVDYNGEGFNFAVESESVGGGVYTTNITETFTTSNYFYMVAGYQVAWNGSAWFYYSNSASGVTTSTNPIGASWDGPIDPWGTSANNVGYMTGGESSDTMSGGDGVLALSDASGHVTYSTDNGQTWTVVTPIPYTSTTFSISQQNAAVITFDNFIFEAAPPPAVTDGPAANNEKVIITNAGEYNGTYYVNFIADNAFTLCTDLGLTTPLDSSGFAPFTTGTVTFSHGQYIDAMDYANGYFYIGNDNEQVARARTTNMGSWTIIDDQNNAFNYWNDFYGYSTPAAISQLTNNSYSVVLNDDGSITLPTLGMTAYQPGYTINGPTLQMGNDPTVGEVIITGPAPDVDNPSARRLIIQGQRGYGSWVDTAVGEGGDIYIWAGTGGENNAGGVGSGGDIKIRGGVGQAGTENGSRTEGGYVKIEGGDVQWGYGTGGAIDINAGSATSNNNGAGDGGDVNIRAGVGTVNNGTVTIQTSSDGSNYNNSWQFDNGGTLQTNGSVYINGEGQGLIVDYTYKRVGFMKYTGMEASFIHANTHPFQIGRVDGTDITTKGMADFTSEVYISSTGKVGINNSSPVEQLDVDGNIKTSGRLIITGTAPTSSQGAIGDKAGMVAVDASAIYYCIATHGETYIITFVIGHDGTHPSIYQTGVPKPLTGWTFGYNATTYTLISDAVELNPGEWALDLNQSISVTANATASLTPSLNIWVKQAWGTTGSW